MAATLKKEFDLKLWKAITCICAVFIFVGVLVLATVAGKPKLTITDQRIAVVDGPRDDQHIVLDTTFFRPVHTGPVPAVLLAHGFGGGKAETRADAERLARHGYAVLTWSARGFGQSSGDITLDSPAYDVKDVRQLIDWLGRRPEVRRDGPDDPRVGIAGQSYGGGISLMAAAYDRRVDAIAPAVTWYDLADSLFPDATGKGARNGVFKKEWAGILFASGASSNACGRFLPSLCVMYQKVAATGQPTSKAIATLRRSSPSSVVGRIHVPTLLIQGQNDSLFPLDQADRNARAITGAPVKVVWFQGGHDGGDQETSRVDELVTGWFDRYLKDSSSTAGGGFTVTRPGGIDSSSQQVTINAASTASYPGLSGTVQRVIPLSGNPQTIRNPAGGSPPSISTLPGLSLLSGVKGLSTRGIDRALPGQSKGFNSAPLKSPLQLTGSARVRLRVRVVGATRTGTRPTLFAKLYDVGPDGGTLPTRRLTTPLKLDGTAQVTLPAMDYQFAKGHRIRLLLSATDIGFASPTQPVSYQVSVESPLIVPTIPALHAQSSPLPWWVWGFPVIALVAVVIMTATRNRTADGDRTNSTTPLEISGLKKRYKKNGHPAVDGLSFTVERGQVCGLLGPNGAGKTTVLRMLMGLIHPDSGEIRVFGETVRPGAPVLSRLGSFVEGPGFLPHLSGRKNLDLYWMASGRGESHIEVALEIAGLGEAIHDPVRTYSQGMRQRLAIAQAMLGLPELLILDEPTNGLDPPQIAEMRNILLRYAAEGRTVIISSHLLAEVEQTCTDVIVMNKGRLVAAGPMGEIAGHTGSIVIDTPDVDRALRLLATLEGIEDFEPCDPGVLVRINGSMPSVVVAALVAGGVPVDRVTPQPRLENAFLTLIGSTHG